MVRGDVFWKNVQKASLRQWCWHRVMNKRSILSTEDSWKRKPKDQRLYVNCQKANAAESERGEKGGSRGTNMTGNVQVIEPQRHDIELQFQPFRCSEGSNIILYNFCGDNTLHILWIFQEYNVSLSNTHTVLCNGSFKIIPPI